VKVLFLNGPGFDYMTAQICEGFHLLHKDGELEFKALHRITHHGAAVHDMPETPLDEAIDAVGWADYVLYSTAGAMDHMNGPVREALEDPDNYHKNVMLDGHDGDGFLIDPRVVLVYFKREFRLPKFNNIDLFNVRSLVFGICDYLIQNLMWHDSLDEDWSERDIDVSFMAFGGSNPIRRKCADVLEQIAQEKGWNLECHVQDDGQPIPLDRYHEMLYRSKVGISMPGAGLDTNRYWEIPAHGAVLATYDFHNALFVRNNFEANRHCLHLQSWQAMAELCHAVVTDKTKWVQLRSAADRHLQFHTTRSRAKEIIQICDELASVRGSNSSCMA